MIKPQCEFTGNRCVKDTCENCSIYEINNPTVPEEVYDRYYDMILLATIIGQERCQENITSKRRVNNERR